MDRLAAEAATDVQEMRNRVAADDPVLVRMECQYVTLMATHAQRQNDSDGLQRALAAARELLPRATGALKKKDANRLALLNTTIQLHSAMNGDPEELAKLYGRFVSLLRLIHGNRTARLLMPEYAALLGRVKWHGAVINVINEYLELAEGEEISGEEFARLNRATESLTAWGVAHKEPFQRLRTFRDAGFVRSEQSYEDQGLVADQKALQGKWTAADGGLTLEMTIDGDRGLVEGRGPEGNLVMERGARFVLSRTGPLSLMTIYREGTRPEDGDSCIYSLKGDTLIHAHGMMREGHNVADPKMQIWRRKRTPPGGA